MKRLEVLRESSYCHHPLFAFRIQVCLSYDLVVVNWKVKK